MEGRIKNPELSSSATIKCIHKPRSTVIDQDTYREPSNILVNKPRHIRGTMVKVRKTNLFLII